MAYTNNNITAFDVEYPQDPQNALQWRRFLTHIRSHDDPTGNGVLSLYLKSSENVSVFIQLVDARRMGTAIAAQISKYNYRQLPIQSDFNLGPARPKWVLYKHTIPSRECWELFIGNLESPIYQYHYLFASREEAEEAHKAGQNAAPHYAAYILRHYFKEPLSHTSDTEYFPLNMP